MMYAQFHARELRSGVRRPTRCRGDPAVDSLLASRRKATGNTYASALFGVNADVAGFARCFVPLGRFFKVEEVTA